MYKRKKRKLNLNSPYFKKYCKMNNLRDKLDKGKWDPELRRIVRLMYEALNQVEDGLTEWEISFLSDTQDVFEQVGGLSEAQLKKLEQIYERMCG